MAYLISNHKEEAAKLAELSFSDTTGYYAIEKEYQIAQFNMLLRKNAIFALTALDNKTVNDFMIFIKQYNLETFLQLLVDSYTVLGVDNQYNLLTQEIYDKYSAVLV